MVRRSDGGRSFHLGLSHNNGTRRTSPPLRLVSLLAPTFFTSAPFDRVRSQPLIQLSDGHLGTSHGDTSTQSCSARNERRGGPRKKKDFFIFIYFLFFQNPGRWMALTFVGSEVRCVPGRRSIDQKSNQHQGRIFSRFGGGGATSSVTGVGWFRSAFRGPDPYKP